MMSVVFRIGVMALALLGACLGWWGWAGFVFAVLGGVGVSITRRDGYSWNAN